MSIRGRERSLYAIDLNFETYDIYIAGSYGCINPSAGCDSMLRHRLRLESGPGALIVMVGS